MSTRSRNTTNWLAVALIAAAWGCGDDGGSSQTGTGDGSTGASGATTSPTTGGADDPSTGSVDTSSASTGTSSASTSTGSADTATESSTGPGAVCGDGMVDEGEQCDDGNEDDADGCTTECIIPAGTTGWELMFPGGGNSYQDDGGFAVAVDSQGNVIVTGELGGRSWIGKYDSAGNELWTDTYSQISYRSWNSMTGVVIDDNDEIYVAGTIHLSAWVGGYTRKYGAGGNVVWTHQEGGMGVPDRFVERRDVALFSDRSTVSVGFSRDDTGEPNRMRIIKLDPSGIPLWERDNGPAGNGVGNRAWAVATDSNDDFIVAGSDQDGTRAWIRKYDVDGQTIWTETFPPPDGYGAQAFDVTVDANDQIAVIGSARPDLTGIDDYWFRIYAPDGSEVRTVLYNGIPNLNDVGYGIASDGAGSFGLVGQQENLTDHRMWMLEVDELGDPTYELFPFSEAERSSMRAVAFIDEEWMVATGIAPPEMGDARPRVWLAQIHR